MVDECAEDKENEELVHDGIEDRTEFGDGVRSAGDVAVKVVAGCGEGEDRDSK